MASVGLMSLVLACPLSEDGHKHSDEHPAGHDHHEEGHGHGDMPVSGITLWGEKFELFGEHRLATVGEPVEFLLHLTVLDGFRALEQGSVHLELEGPASLRGEATKALRPGIFQIGVTPPLPGIYRGKLTIEGADSGVIEGIELQVYEDSKSAVASASDEEHHGRIEFLKEQQWGVPFATAFADQGHVVPSVEVAGRVATPPGGRAEVGAAITGRLVVPVGGLARPGSRVRKGQLLASLVPAPASPENVARASLAQAEAKARLEAARVAVERTERLLKDEAIPRREFEVAVREAKLAEEAVLAARRSSALYSGQRGAKGLGSWRLTAPIGGTLVSVTATPGATVAPGKTLFQIVDSSELWIVARVPEQDAARLRTDRNASYRVTGLEDWVRIDVSSKADPYSTVTVGRVVDPIARTVDVIYSLGAADASLRVGGLVQISLPAGADFEGVVVPRSALIDREGRIAVYVQVDGEHFEERLVRLGPRSGNKVGVLSGLKAGERIVTQGARLVRLAERAGTEQPHGHIH